MNHRNMFYIGLLIALSIFGYFFSIPDTNVPPSITSTQTAIAQTVSLSHTPTATAVPKVPVGQVLARKGRVFVAIVLSGLIGLVWFIIRTVQRS